MSTATINCDFNYVRPGWKGIIGSSIIGLNRWRHVAATYDGQTAKIFIDGKLDAVQSLGVTISNGGAGAYLSIGNNPGGADEYLSGTFDEIRIWSISRSQQKIRSSMYVPLTRMEPGLLAYYNFNEGYGQIVGDKSGYNRNAHLGTSLSPETKDPVWVKSTAPLFSLVGSGTARPGGTVTLDLNANNDPGLFFQLGSSLGTGPIPIDTRNLGLSPDNLLQISVGGLWPGIFSGYSGTLDGQGQAKASINIPNIPFLIGLHIHTAFVTLDPLAPSGIKSISNTFSFSITK